MSNPILMGQALPLTHRYYVMVDDVKGYLNDGNELLRFLQNNDPVEAGCDLLTDDEWQAIQNNKREY